MITTIYDNLDIELDEMRQWLQINVIDLTEEEDLEGPSELEDDELQRLIDAAKRKADNFCQRDEEYFEGGNGIEIPEDIKTWCMMYVGRMYERRLNGLEQLSIDGSDSTSWSDELDYDLLWPYRNMDFGRIKEDE